MNLVQIFLYFWLQIDLMGKKAAKTLAVWWEKYECEYWQGEEEDANNLFPNSLSNYDLDCVEDEVMVMHRIWIFHKIVVLLVLWLSVTEERCPSKSLSASAVNANRWWNSWRLFLIKNYNISPRYIMVTGKHRTTFIRERNVFPERRGQWCGTANVRKLI